MKSKQIKLSILAMAIVSASTAMAGKIIDLPFIGDSNSSTVDIDRVELTDTATILTMHGYYRPHNWIKLSPESELQADGKSYKLIGSKGMVPDKELWMPESGDSVFTMIFEPLPFSTESFDFTEGDGAVAFSLWDVDLTGKVKSFTEYPAGLPAELRRKPVDGSLPELVYEIGKTTVNVHYLPLRPGRRLDNEGIVTNLFGGYEEVIGKVDEATGTVTYSFNQYGPGRFSFPCVILNVAPGETLDVYVDTRTVARNIADRRDGQPESYYTPVYSTGRYGNLDTAVSRYKGDILIPSECDEFWNYKMSGDEYVDVLEFLYGKTMERVDKLDSSDMMKEYMRNAVKNSTLFCGNSKNILSQSYSNKHDYTRDIPQDSIKGDLSPDNLARIASLFDLCDKGLLFTPNIGDLLYGWRIDWTQYGAECNPVSDVLTAMPYWGKAKNASVTPEDLDALAKLDNPFFAKAVKARQDEAQAFYDSLKGNADITPTPDVPLGQLFEAIIAPYKGKVVVVDFWDTWCGPCRNAIRYNEPKKDSVYKDADVEWVYIADDSSPMPKYMQMIGGIKGHHYYLNEEQIRHLNNQLRIDGIPFYVLVEKDGTYRCRPDMRDPDTYEKAVKDALKK